MAPKQKAQQQPAQRYLGQKDPKTGKVWAGDGWGWQAPATYTRLAGERRLNTQKNPLNWIDNNLQHLFGVSNSLNKGTKLVGRAGFLPIYEEPGGRVSSSTPAQRQVAHATTVQPLSNAAMAVTNLGQRLLSGEPLKPRKPEGTRAGQAIQQLNDQAAVAMGAKPVGQLTQSQRDLISSLPSSIATNTALAFAPFLRVGAIPFAAVASKAPLLSPGAQQVLARGLQWGANAGLNEAASGLLDDSTQGQAGDLLKAAGLPVPNAFVTQPEDDRISAGVRGIIPGIAFGELLGAPLGLLSRATELAPNAMRALREQRTTADVARVRQETVNAGLQQPDGLAGYQFTRDLQESTETPVAALPARAAAPSESAGVATADVAAADGSPVDVEPGAEAIPVAGDQLVDASPLSVPTAEPALPTYDPSLLEVDAAALALDRLDDGQLSAVAQGEGPVLPRLEEAMASQQLPEVDPGRSTTWTAAPAEALTPPATPWREQWEGLPNNELLGVADPQVSPDLFEKTAAITGKSWEQFTRADVLDGLSQLEVEGQVVLPQRLGEGQVLADVQGLQVDPLRLQFRAGADPESGVIPGMGIEGPWDVAREGKISIWQDPQTGDQVLVDGHRRVEAARRLGIPTIPAEEVLAPTADVARAQGAMRNIQEGTASPLDGGRALRQQGLMDPGAIEGAGLPLGEGAAAGSAAIAGLPDAVFRAAEAGELPVPRATAIGGSGLDANGQMAALRFARSPRSAQLNDAAFGELMQMAGASQRGAGAVAEDGAPIKAPSVLDFDRLASKAQLAAVARQGLSGRALELFDQGKVNPADAVSQLLDQGVAEVAGGSRMDVVGRRLQRQIEQAEKALPPVEAAAAVEQAMPEAQGPMTTADRQALRAQVLQQAIDGGELRPSSQPIIPSPDPLQVDVPAAMRDLEQQLTTTGTIAPDTPAARLLEEEARLEAEYGARDAVVAEELRRAQREAADFWNLSFDDRVRQGLIDEGWTPKGEAETPDTRGSGRYFHGTSQEIPGDKPSSVHTGDHWTDGNLFGNGFYATDDFHTAGNTYTQKGKREALRPEVPIKMYAATDELTRFGGASPTEAWNLTRRTTDIPAPERLREIAGNLDQTINQYGDTSGRMADLKARLLELADNPPKAPEYRPVAYEVIEKAPVKFIDADRPIPWGEDSPEAKMLQAPGGELWNDLLEEWKYSGELSYGQVLDLVKDLGTDRGWARGDVTDTIDSLNADLAKLGYGGLRHQGGVRAGGGKRLHDVRIYWDPEKQITLKRVGAAGPDAEQALNNISSFEREQPSLFIELGGDLGAAGQIDNMLTEVVRQVSGKDAPLALFNRYQTAKRKPEWGGGDADVVTNGSYQVMRDLISINGVLEGSEQSLIRTAYHEAFHRVQYGLLSQQEMKVLDSAYGLRKINRYSGLSPQDVATIERMAVAFENYASIKRNGGNFAERDVVASLIPSLPESLPAKAAELAVGVAKAFDKLLDLIDRVKNFAQGNGFQTLNDVFERVYSGRIARDRAFNSALELLEPDQVARAKRLDAWSKDNAAPSQDIAAALSGLDARIAELKSRATAGGC